MSCAHCGQHIQFPMEGLGMLVECPGCGREIVLGETSGETSSHAEAITAGELQSALTGEVPRRRISILYQVGLLVVAFFMVLLPLAYVGVAVCAAYGVCWYADFGRVLFSDMSGGVYLLMLKGILYIGPIVGGAVAVFFLFKPLLARRAKRAEPIELNPAEHPRLYQFIAHVSDLLRVAMPRQIYLDCELNASVAWRRGWLSFLGRDLVLHLGLPLVAGLNTRQFAAVVAHELGHCTQAFAMRLGYVIQRVNGWFARVVYERDAWDQGLEEWSNSVEDWRGSLIVACVNLAVAISRGVLLVFMLAGQAASCFLSRQMEYHADACAMAIAGSEGLESLLLRLREQAVLEQMGYDGLRQIWKQRHHLPESLPAFLEELEKRLPADFHEEARQTLLNEKAGWLATHPTAAQRIQRARRRGVAGVFDLERPARELFRDFATTARRVSGRHYRQTLGLAVTDPMLKPVDGFFQEAVIPVVSPVISAPRPGRRRIVLPSKSGGGGAQRQTRDEPLNG